MIDVAIVGGGFAGLIAARELGKRGFDVTLIEARDRLGGRTWVAPFGGTEVEMGGTFVHWIQPHVWAEMSRYGLRIRELPEVERSILVTDDGPHELAGDDWVSLTGALERACHDAATVLPDPVSIPEGAAAEAADHETLAERLASTEAQPLERVVLDSLATGMSSTSTDRVSYLWGLVKPFALANHDARLMSDVNGRFVIDGGTRALVDSVAADTPATFRFEERVTALEQRDGSVTVTLAGDEILEARAGVLALPVNAWRHIAFSPGLSAIKQEAASNGLTSRGVKVWAKVVPGLGPVLALADGEHRISILETSETRDDGDLLVGFGPSAADLPLDDHDTVSSAIRELLPDADVLETGGHDWTNDPLSGETWATYGPGTYTRWAPELGRFEGRIVFAGGDFATAWPGYIDGAIETGLRAAREVARLLA